MIKLGQFMVKYEQKNSNLVTSQFSSELCFLIAVATPPNTPTNRRLEFQIHFIDVFRV